MPGQAGEVDAGGKAVQDRETKTLKTERQFGFYSSAVGNYWWVSSRE